MSSLVEPESFWHTGAEFGASTVVVAVAVLFPEVLSLGDETVAEFVMLAGPTGAVATIVMMLDTRFPWMSFSVA